MDASLNPTERRSHGPLRILIVARVSDPRPGKQDERSVHDQEHLCRNWVEQNLSGSSRIEVFASRGRGEWLDRGEFLELTDLINEQHFDVLVTEDLGRILRRLQAHMFAEECVDLGTRLIAINDHVDTNEPGWQDRSIFSAWHHERSNRDTSDRIKRAHRARFVNGGCAALPIYGYIKPPGAKSDADWYRDPEAEAVYREIFERLDRHEDDREGYSEIADWLNASGVPTGPYCDADQWDGAMLKRVVHNPMLKGLRRRNDRETYRDSRGRYRTRKAPQEKRLKRPVPHLAFFEENYYDRVLRKVDRKNSRYRRDQNGDDPRNGVPRSRTRFPGQSIYCGICGRLCVFGGHGQRDRLMCNGARSYQCWNGVTVNGPLAAEKISAEVLRIVESLPQYDSQLLAEVSAEAERQAGNRDARLAEVDAELKRIDRRLENLIEFIAEGRSSEAVRAEIEHQETAQTDLRAERQELISAPQHRVDIPPPAELRELARDALRGILIESPDFCRLMHRLIPRIVVFPFRLIDGGTPVLRAQFQLHPSGLLDDARARTVLEHPLAQHLTVDLFDPPQREAFRQEIMRLRASGYTEREAAAACGITVTTASQAAALQRRLDVLGTVDPYFPLHEPPDDYPKLRRHRHERYCFEPLPDAGQV